VAAEAAVPEAAVVEEPVAQEIAAAAPGEPPAEAPAETPAPAAVGEEQPAVSAEALEEETDSLDQLFALRPEILDYEPVEEEEGADDGSDDRKKKKKKKRFVEVEYDPDRDMVVTRKKHKHGGEWDQEW
jgi:hypothetical protein